MKILLIVIPLFFINPVVGFQEKKIYKDEIFAGKLVIKGPCGQRVVSIISSYNKNVRVQENWQDPVTGESFKKVFSVRNYCEVSSLEEGDTFHFKFIKMKMSVCPTCLLYRPVPEADGAIVIVSKDSTSLFKYINN